MSFFYVQSQVPVADTEDNNLTRDVIGNKQDKSYGDYVAYPSVMGHLKAAYYHVHDSAKLYPTGDATHGAEPVTLTSANTEAWLHGAKTQIIAANTITTAFDIHWVLIGDISAVDDYELRLYKGGIGAESLIATIGFVRSSNFSQEGSSPIQVSPLPANTRISASLACGDGDGATCKVKLYSHSYPDITGL